MDKKVEKLQAEVERLKQVLRFIGSHKCCDEVRNLDKMAASWGLEREEFVQMAHDNLVVAARNALKRPRKPKAIDPPGTRSVAQTLTQAGSAS